MKGLVRRLRRLRSLPRLREQISETRLSPSDFVMPYFVRTGKGERRPIRSMPGQFQLSVDELVKAVRHLRGVTSILLFGIPASKDSTGREAYARSGIVQRAVRAVKDASPETVVMTDVCLCEYTDHGHCGVVRKTSNGFQVDNDRTLDLLARSAVSHAEAGADLVAPSAMMDGQVRAIRQALDQSGHADIPIMAYAAKYASGFYGPFRDAAESPPQFGDRSTYQMDIRNSDEALREIELDIQEGADIVMVKPALAYLDILRAARDRFRHPMAAYNVSGEYAMVKAAAERQWLDEKRIATEILTSIKRAGANLIISYWADRVSEWL
jgi:porphobilinogen synthase